MSGSDAVEITQSLVRVNTINPPGNEDECAAVLARILTGAGFRCETFAFAPRRTSLVATIGGSDRRKPLCFTGHLDVVPLGSAPWSQEPFAANIVDGKLYGRGSSDMKSGVAAFVAAAVDLAPRLGSSAGLVVVLTAGEETGCEGAADLARLHRERGILHRAGALIVGEPTANYPVVGHKGALWVRARTTGVTAHGSMPERGDNAIYKAARAITRLEDFELSSTRHPLMGRTTLNVGTIRGGLNINSVPDAAEFHVDIRTLPGQRHQDLLQALQEQVGADVALSSVVDVPGVFTEASDPWISSVFAIMRPLLGQPPESRAVPYVTDAAALKPAYAGPPTIILGPGQPELAHQTDEFCRIDRIFEAYDTYSAVIRDWMGAD